MTDLDDLRHALHSPPGFTPRVLDLDTIMARGGRLRARRRWGASAAVALSVAAVLIGGGMLADRGPETTPAGVGPVPAPPSVRPSVGATPGPESTPPEPNRPLGRVIRTGMTAAGGEWVLYGVPVRQDSLPAVHFGVMLGLRTPTGTLLPKITVNETEGSDRSPGFHEGEVATTVDGADAPAFGYFAGPVARITATVHGRSVSARLAAWSEDPAVTVFWFRLSDVRPGVPVAKLTAFDRTGRKLGTSTSGLGVG